MPYALLFDVDGVIADTEPLSARAATAAFRELYNIEIPLSEHLAYTGGTHKKHVLGLAARYKLAVDIEEAIAAHQRHFLLEMEAAGDLRYPGVQEIITLMAADRDWRLGLATGSGRERSRATLAKAGLDTANFAVWLTGDDISRAKPDPEIYLKAASQLRLFPTQCVVIEDSIAGVASAKAAHMRCIAVTNTYPGEALHAADRIVDSLAEISPTMLYDLAVEG
jgi:HAD superfamily hydrolase (TIGR01509 family)